MRTARVKKCWFEVIAQEKHDNGELYEHRLFVRTIAERDAVRWFWWKFSDWVYKERIKSVEITICRKVKSKGEDGVKKWIDGRFRNLPFLEEFARRQ